MSGYILAVHEARVRHFDEVTKVATVVMPGPYGMEPIEAAPFVRQQIIPGDIESLVVGDRVLVTMNENEPPEWISVNVDWMTNADARYVNRTGDTMTGQLIMRATAVDVGEDQIILSKFSESEWAYMSFHDELGVEAGWVGLTNAYGTPPTEVVELGSNTAVRIWAAGGSSTFGDGIFFYTGGVETGWFGSGGQLQIYGPGTVTDSERIKLYGHPGSEFPWVGLYNTSGSIRYGWWGGGLEGMWFESDMGDTRISSSGDVIFMASDSDRARFTADKLLVGKSSSNWQAVNGVEVHGIQGLVLSTMNVASSNFWCNHIGAADVNSCQFITFRRTTAGTYVGGIAQSTTTGIVWNETSHGPFKGNVQDLDDDEALARVEQWRPVSFQWRLDEEGSYDDRAEPNGEVRHGFIAQELYEVQPSAVTVGFGVQDDERGWLNRRREHLLDKEQRLAGQTEWDKADPKSRRGERPIDLPEFDEPEPFMPWGTDNSKLVPDLSAAVQALIRKIRAQGEEIAELRRMLPGGNA